jgi:hypothetical protein
VRATAYDWVAGMGLVLQRHFVIMRV